MNPNDKKFQQLRAEWYSKLKDKGFKDIEYDDTKLNRYDSHYFTAEYGPVEFEARKTYYKLAGQFLYNYSFKNERQKLIWQFHAQGMYLAEIVKALKEKNYLVSPSHVHRQITKLKKIMMQLWTDEV